MRKIIFGIIIALMVQGTVSAWYDTPHGDYRSFEEQLKAHVDEVPYDVRDYRLGEFDCTNMAALTHDTLEDKGYDVKIVKGENGGYTNNHAWVLIVAGGVDYHIETTAKEVFKDKYPHEFGVVEVYDDYGGHNCGWLFSEWQYESYLSR